MKTRILIAGIGGVGGFLGSKLAGYSFDYPELEIYFLCRGEHLRVILENGLTLKEGDSASNVTPFAAASDCTAFPKMDYIFMACKSYDLNSISELIRPCVNNKTTIIPLLNGVNAADELKSTFPEAKVCMACIYIVAQLEKPGLIVMPGKNHSLQFGIDAEQNQSLKTLEEILNNAHINTELADDISLKVWRKFSFISPLASYTSATHLNIKTILENPQHLNALTALLEEIKKLADSMHIPLPADIIDLHLTKIKSLPDETTSSMERDFALGKKTELEPLCAYVVEKGKEMHLNLTNYNNIYQALLNQSKPV